METITRLSPQTVRQIGRGFLFLDWFAIPQRLGARVTWVSSLEGSRSTFPIFVHLPNDAAVLRSNTGLTMSHQKGFAASCHFQMRQLTYGPHHLHQTLFCKRVRQILDMAPIACVITTFLPASNFSFPSDIRICRYLAITCSPSPNFQLLLLDALRITSRKHGVNEGATRSDAALAVQSIPAYVEADGVRFQVHKDLPFYRRPSQ